MINSFPDHQGDDQYRLQISSPCRIEPIISKSSTIEEFNLNLDNSFDLDLSTPIFCEITSFRLISGSGKSNVAGSFKNWLLAKTGNNGSIIRVPEDNCLMRSVVTGLAKIHNNKYDTVRKGDKSGCTRQRKEGLKLLVDSGQSSHKKSFGFDEIRKLESYLNLNKPNTYRIRIRRILLGM